MRDIHCHILPGVDDGARDLAMSLSMLEAAKAAGVTSIVCTPHCRDPYFDYDAMWAAFRELQAHADGFPLQMGFEVAHPKLMELGVEQWAPYLCFDGATSFSLSLTPTLLSAILPTTSGPSLAACKVSVIAVIIAHPERYRAIQKEPDIAERLVRMGCHLQASSDFLAGGSLW